MNGHNRNHLIGLPFLLSTLLLLLLFAYLTVETSVNAQQPVYRVRLDGLKKDMGGQSSRYIVTNTGLFSANTFHQFYNDSDQPVSSFADTIGVGASKVYSLADISYLPSGYTGYIIISADMPITASLLPEPPIVVPPQSVEISGCLAGILSTSYTFTATVAPATATVPMTYVWQASTNTMITHTADLSDTVVYSWTIPGLQAITVTAANASGWVWATCTLEIYPSMRANFTASPTKGYAPLIVTFTNTSEGDYSTAFWTFGDEATSSDTNPTHTYVAAGVYTASLMISGLAGSDAITRSNYITVNYGVFLPVVSRQ